MSALFAAGMLTWWLLPIALSLVLAPVLSWALSAAPEWGMGLFRIPQDAGAVEAPRRFRAKAAA